MPRTRSTKGAAAGDSQPESPPDISPTGFTLTPGAGRPPMLFVLPKRATADAKIITLPHPQHGKPSRYLVCPETGFYEFTNIATSKSLPRSWLVESESPASAEASGAKDETRRGQMISKADLHVATPIDPLFLLLPAFAAPFISKSADEKKPLFLSSDDYLEKLPTESSHLSEAIRCEKTRRLLEARMAAMCDTVDAGDEVMYRVSREKTLTTCLQKARQIVDGDALPPSLERQFVAKALQAPVLSQKRAPVSTEASAITESTDSVTSTPQTESNSAESASTAATSVDGEVDSVQRAMEPTPEIISLQRLRVAFDFLCERLLSPEVTRWLKEGLSSENAGGVNFGPLDEYTAKLAEYRAEALASRSIGDYSRKHMRDEDEEEAREQKKRKMEEEKRKKANESRGVRDLKKVNTSGMKKLSHFFQKK